MHAFGTLVGLSFIVAVAGRAAAQPEPVVSVTRGPGAEECPDSFGLLERIAALRGRPEAGATVAYQVAFTRENTGFCAEIRGREGASGARRLCDQGQTCAALEQAAAVTLALLLDSDARASTPPPTAPVTAPAPPPPPAPSIAMRSDTEASDDDAPAASAGVRRATLALGAAGVAAVVRPIAPAIDSEVGLRFSRVRVGAGVLWAPALARDLGPGSVRESLLSGHARACFAPLLGAGLRFDVCSGVYAGVLHAEASGFTRNQSAARAWLALPLGVALASTPAPLGWELSAAALVPLRRQDFAIDNVGVAYASLPVGVLVALRGVGLWAF